MKQFRRFLWALLLIGMAIAIYSSAVGETAPEKINWGGAEPAAGSWARTADAMEFSYPMDAARDEPTILLSSAWQKYQVLVDGNVVYTASSERNGAFHLFRLPPGQELTVRFLDCAPGSGAESAVLQSQVYFGSRSGIQWMILRENLYAVLFSGFALVLGIACLLAAYCMQRQHFGNFYGSVYSLGAYILLAGVWVLTDSKILLLVSQKAGLVGLISYLSFHALYLPLLQFTIGVLPEKRRMLEILQAFYSGLLLLLMANFIFSLPYLNVLVMSEHLLMTVTIALILYHGFREMHRGKTRRWAVSWPDMCCLPYAAFWRSQFTIWTAHFHIPRRICWASSGSSCCWLRRPGSAFWNRSMRTPTWPCTQNWRIGMC